MQRTMALSPTTEALMRQVNEDLDWVAEHEGELLRRCLAAWVAATLVCWSVATEAPAQRQSPSAESKAPAAGAETAGGAADAGQGDRRPVINGQHRMTPVSVQEFGAKGDGVTDGLTS